MLAVEKIGCFLFLGCMSLFDIRSKRLPDKSLYLGILAAISVRVIFKGLPLKSYIIAALIGVLFITVSYFTNEKIGYGDGLIILYTGLLLGVENLLFIIFSALVMCSLTGIVFMITRSIKSDFSLPFVPFIFAGFMLLLGFQGCSV